MRSGDLIQFAGPLSVPGGIRLRGGDGTNQVQFLGTGVETATFTPDSALENAPGLSKTAVGGKLVLSGGSFVSTTVDITEFSSSGTVLVNGFSDFKWISPGTGHVNLTVNGSTLSGQLQGPKGLVGIVKAVFFNTTNVVVDATPFNAGVIDVSDTFTIGSAGLSAPGLKNLTFLGGVGNDTLQINAANFALPVFGGAFIFDGGNSGADVVASSADADFTLTDTTLSTSATSVVQLQNLVNSQKIANISGGNSDNILTVKSWSGTGTINGQAGNDTIAFGDGGDIDAVTGRFAVIGGSGTDTLRLDDSGNAALEDYNVGSSLATSNGAFGGVTYDSTIEDIVVIGSTGNNLFVVTPNLGATVHIDGNNPPVGTLPPERGPFQLEFQRRGVEPEIHAAGAGRGGVQLRGGAEGSVLHGYRTNWLAVCRGFRHRQRQQAPGEGLQQPAGYGCLHFQCI